MRNEIKTIFIISSLSFISFLFLKLKKKKEMIKKIMKILSIEVSQKKNKDIKTKELQKIEELNKLNKLTYKDIAINNLRNSFCYISCNNIDILEGGKEKFVKLFNDIKNAKESINVLYYIFDTKSEIGKEFLDILINKAREGLEVKLVYDRLGKIKVKKSDFRKLENAGGKVKVYMPTLCETLLFVNTRQHRKIVLIDNKIAYMGGINVGDEYLGKNKKLSPWQDISLKIIGDSIYALKTLFDMSYDLIEDIENINSCKRGNLSKINANNNIIKMNTEVSKTKILDNEIIMQILASGKDVGIGNIRHFYVNMIRNAKKYLYIVTPYFIPDKIIIYELKQAKLRNVDVRIILPNKIDKVSTHFASLSYIEELLKFGVKVYQYKGFVHAKLMIIDDCVTSIGTANLDMRSFYRDFEINAAIYNKNFTCKIKEILLNDIKFSKDLCYDIYKGRSILIKFLEHVFKMFSPIL